jgi:hypothetical protein
MMTPDEESSSRSHVPGKLSAKSWDQLRAGSDTVCEAHISLNPSQRQRLLVTCKHIDDLLGDIEATLNTTASKSIFPAYVGDVSPAQRSAIEASVSRMRRQLLQVLSRQSLAPESPTISAAHSIRVNLTFVEIAIAELAPHYMRGYGPISQEGAADLTRIMGELQSMVEALRGCLPQHSPDPDGK